MVKVLQTALSAATRADGALPAAYGIRAWRCVVPCSCCMDAWCRGDAWRHAWIPYTVGSAHRASTGCPAAMSDALTPDGTKRTVKKRIAKTL
jgi:hypothetical protein